MNNTGSRLMSLRHNRGVTQAELAEALGVTQATVASWENGRRDPAKEYKIKLANYYKVSIEPLFYGDVHYEW